MYPNQMLQLLLPKSHVFRLGTWTPTTSPATSKWPPEPHELPAPALLSLTPRPCASPPSLYPNSLANYCKATTQSSVWGLQKNQNRQQGYSHLEKPTSTAQPSIPGNLAPPHVHLIATTTVFRGSHKCCKSSSMHPKP